jgi:glycosyltransferase involved in cell wall biosynthesis
MKYKLLFLTSHPSSVRSFILPHARVLQKYYDIKILANTNDNALIKRLGVNISVNQANVLRSISILKDLKTLWSLYWNFKRNGLFSVHTITPKAGLLGMLAAWLARVPLRIHSFTGQVWVTRNGLIRWFLKNIDKILGILATHTFADSHSQLKFLIEQGITNKKNCKVLAQGSICGVNTNRFSPDLKIRKIVRRELKTKNNTLVCLYLGRLNKDKGVLDLAEAFVKVTKIKSNVELWIVGPDEENIYKEMRKKLKKALCQVKRVGFTAAPENYMKAADLLCLPSYREGFGSTVIESAACSIPALVTNIYGLKDAVIEGKTGWTFESKNIQDLLDKLNLILSNPKELKIRGKAARIFVKKKFSEKKVTYAMLNFYKNYIKKFDKKFFKNEIKFVQKH